MQSAADQFLRGKPVVYTGFDGRLYVATYSSGERNGLGLGHLEIANATGRFVSEPLMMTECEARTFFWNLDAQAEYGSRRCAEESREEVNP